jgi:hypothetical protein
MSDYALPSDLLMYKDARTIGDLAGDLGVRVTPSAILTNPNVLAALASSAGMINSAILIGNRYTILELQALTGDDFAFLVRINCDLAFGILIGRRGNSPEQDPDYKEAKMLLEMMRDGKAIFNVPGDVAVGTPAPTFPSFINYARLGLLRDRARPLFPRRRYQQEQPGY